LLLLDYRSSDCPKWW